MDYKLTIDFETEEPFDKWSLTEHTSLDLTTAIMKILGVRKATVPNIKLTTTSWEAGVDK